MANASVMREVWRPLSAPHEVPAIDAPEVKVLERAHKLSVQWTTPVKADYLVETLGAKLAAATVGLRDARTVVSWAEGGPIKSVTQEHRLQAVFRVTYALTERYSPSVAAAFLRGSNPQLDGRAPLLVLATEPPADAEAAAVRAVEALFEL